MNFQEVEKARKVYYSKLKRQTIITVAILVTLFLIMGLSGAMIVESLFGFFFIAFFITMIAVVIASLSNRKASIAYRHAYKAYFVERNLRAVFSDLSYSHEAGLPSSSLHQTGMINTGDRYSSNDLTHGKYQNVNFTQADVHIENQYTDSDGHTHYTTIFKGRFMIFEFPKKFTCRLGVFGRQFRACYKPANDASSHRKIEKITTESNEFNKTFRVYSEDGFEAFYILDPAFMVKLMDINERYQGRVIFCFVNNQLVIGIHDGKDSFEPPKLSRPIDETAENAKIHADIKMLTDLVDQLSLSSKAFK